MTQTCRRHLSRASCRFLSCRRRRVMSPHDSQRVNSGGLTAPRQSLRPSFLYLPAPRIGPICRQTWKPGGGREARGFSNGPLGSLPGFFTTTAAVFRLLLSNKLMFQPIVCLSVIKAPPSSSLYCQNRLWRFCLSRIVSLPPAPPHRP